MENITSVGIHHFIDAGVVALVRDRQIDDEFLGEIFSFVHAYRNVLFTEVRLGVLKISNIFNNYWDVS